MLAPQIGKETKVFAKGQWWQIGRLDVDVWDELLAWAEPRIRNPLEDLKVIVKDLPAEVSLPLIRDAMAQRPKCLTIDSPAFQEVIDGTPEGKLQRFYILLKKANPDITRQEAFEILQEIGEQKEQETLATAAGKPPPQRKKKGAAGTTVTGQHHADKLADSVLGAPEHLPLAAVGGPPADAG